MVVLMSKVLYMDDGYLKEFEAEVESVKDNKYVVLAKLLSILLEGELLMTWEFY